MRARICLLLRIHTQQVYYLKDKHLMPINVWELQYCKMQKIRLRSIVFNKFWVCGWPLDTKRVLIIYSHLQNYFYFTTILLFLLNKTLDWFHITNKDTSTFNLAKKKMFNLAKKKKIHQRLHNSSIKFGLHSSQVSAIFLD